VRPVVPASLLTSVPSADDVLQTYASALGHDFVAYRNHVYRVINFCVVIAGDGAAVEKIAVAAAFHDLGIWTNRTFDYIAPSEALARAYLAAHERASWIADIETMIEDHHKITSSATTTPGSLVEPFRRADWIDVTHGLRTFGVPRSFIGSAFVTWPSAGFHWRLVQLTFERLRTHPLTPLPMIKL
jgi:hypothetical protein